MSPTLVRHFCQSAKGRSWWAVEEVEGVVQLGWVPGNFFLPGSHLGSQETAARRRTRCTACTSTSCHATSEAVLHILLSVSQCPIVDCIESISVARMDEVGLGADESFLCGSNSPLIVTLRPPLMGPLHDEVSQASVSFPLVSSLAGKHIHI